MVTRSKLFAVSILATVGVVAVAGCGSSSGGPAHRSTVYHGAYSPLASASPTGVVTGADGRTIPRSELQESESVDNPATSASAPSSSTSIRPYDPNYTAPAASGKLATDVTTNPCVFSVSQINAVTGLSLPNQKSIAPYDKMDRYSVCDYGAGLIYDQVELNFKPSDPDSLNSYVKNYVTPQRFDNIKLNVANLPKPNFTTADGPSTASSDDTDFGFYLNGWFVGVSISRAATATNLGATYPGTVRLAEKLAATEAG